MPTNNNRRTQRSRRGGGQGGGDKNKKNERNNNSSNNNSNNQNKNKNNKPLLSSPSCPTTRTNMRRCQEMMACRNEIATLQKRLHDMRQEQERMGRLAALQACCCCGDGSSNDNIANKTNPSIRAAYVWSSQCSKEERWKKPVVLALLKACPSFEQQQQQPIKEITHLPVPLRLHKWNKKVPRHLREDRDIVLARLQRADLFVGIPTDSTTSSSSSSSSPHVLTIPPRLQKDLSVVLATIRRYPDILFPPENINDNNNSSSKRKQQQQPAKNLLELHADSHVEMFQAVLQAFRLDPNHWLHNGYSAISQTKKSRREFLDLFSSDTIRGNRNLMTQVWKEWVLLPDEDNSLLGITETLFSPSLRDDKAFALQLAAAATNHHRGDDDDTIKKKDDKKFPGTALRVVSKRLRQDKEVVMAFVARNAFNLQYVDSGLEKSWQVVKTALLENPGVLLVTPASTKKRFRWTKSFMMQLFARIKQQKDDEQLITLRNNNNEISVSTFDDVSMVWELCSPKLRQDRDVFMAALRAGGGAGWQYVAQSISDELSKDATTAAAAATSTSIKKESGMQLKNRSSNDNNNNNTIPPFLVEHRDFLVDLIVSGHFSWHVLPKKYRCDKEFAIACLLHGQKKHHHSTETAQQQQQQPPNHEDESSACPCCATYLSLNTVRTMLDYCPTVATDRRTVVSWIRHYHTAVCFCPLDNFLYSSTTVNPGYMSRQVICPCLDWYLHTLPRSIQRDKSIMLEACRVNPAVILYLPVPLQEDRDVVECVLLHSSPSPASSTSSSSSSIPPSSRRKQQSRVSSLQYISAMAQHLYPDLIAQAIRQLPKSTSSSGDYDNDDDDDDDDMEESREYSDSSFLWGVFEDIDEDLWAHREVALAWVERGGAYLQDDFPEDFENDAELFLEIASSPHNWDDFMFASDTLLTDKDFMAKAVTRNGRVLREAMNGLDRDYDLALLAFANTENLVDHYNWTCPGATFSTVARGPTKNSDFEFLVDFAGKVRAELLSHECFIEFLMCVQLPEPVKPTATHSDSHDGSRRRSGTGNRRRRGSGGDKQGNEAGSEPGGGCQSRNHQEKQQQPAAQVHLLAKGAETTLGFTKLVAEFMGIPIGERLRLLRQASANLARWGF